MSACDAPGEAGEAGFAILRQKAPETKRCGPGALQADKARRCDTMLLRHLVALAGTGTTAQIERWRNRAVLFYLAIASALWAAAIPTLSVRPVAPIDPGTLWAEVALRETELGSDGERLVWLIWGRRGAGRGVLPGALTWPQGLQWRTDSTDVSKWGRVVLGEAEVTSEALVARRVSMAAVTNGLISEGEWGCSAAKTIETPVGPLVVDAQHLEGSLQVCVMLPAVNIVSGDTEVLVAAAPPTGDRALAVALRWDPRQRISRASKGTLLGRNWAWQRLARGSDARPGVSGALSPNGDGAWQFLAAEASFATETLGLGPKDTTARLAVFVRGLPRAHSDEDAIYWPAGHGPATEASECMLCENPDSWAKIRPAAVRTQRKEIPLPELPTAPRIDGIVEEGEWSSATGLRNDFLGIAQCPLWIGLHHGALHLAASCQLPRRGLTNPRLEIFVDPTGDGGLLPRPDDRMLCLSQDAGGAKSTLLRWQPSVDTLAAGIITRQGKWTTAAPIAVDAAFHVTDATVCVEAKVPLRALGLDPQQLPENFGLLVRLIYRWQVQAK